MTTALPLVIREEPVFFNNHTWTGPELFDSAEQLRMEVLSVHLEAVLAVTRFAATTERMGFRESADRAYTRARMGYRRVIRLLSKGPMLASHREVLERLRLALPVGDDSDGTTVDAITFDVRDKPVAPRAGMEAPDGSCESLTPRETQLLRLIAEGQSSKQLAFQLGISFKTAVCHRYNIMEKLNLHDVSSLVRFAIRKGLVQA